LPTNVYIIWSSSFKESMSEFLFGACTIIDHWVEFLLHRKHTAYQ